MLVAVVLLGYSPPPTLAIGAGVTHSLPLSEPISHLCSLLMLAYKNGGGSKIRRQIKRMDLLISSLYKYSELHARSYI